MIDHTSDTVWDSWNQMWENQLSAASFRVPTFAMFMPHMQAAMSRTMLHHQRAALSFVEKRCDADLALVDEIDKARSPQDLYTAWRGFFQNAAHHYAEAAEALAKLEVKDAAEVVAASAGEELRDVAISAQMVA